MYYNGAWGTVCDDVWDIQDANVVCRSLGFQTANSAPSSAAFGPGTGAILLRDVGCTGSESSIFDCVHSELGVHTCTESQDVGVRCLKSGTMRNMTLSITFSKVDVHGLELNMNSYISTHFEFPE